MTSKKSPGVANHSISSGSRVIAKVNADNRRTKQKGRTKTISPQSFDTGA